MRSRFLDWAWKLVLARPKRTPLQRVQLISGEVNRLVPAQGPLEPASTLANAWRASYIERVWHASSTVAADLADGSKSLRICVISTSTSVAMTLACPLNMILVSAARGGATCIGCSVVHVLVDDDLETTQPQRGGALHDRAARASLSDTQSETA